MAKWPKKYQAWQKLEKSKGNNQAKPVEPIIAYRDIWSKMQLFADMLGEYLKGN